MRVCVVIVCALGLLIRNAEEGTDALGDALAVNTSYARCNREGDAGCLQCNHEDCAHCAYSLTQTDKKNGQRYVMTTKGGQAIDIRLPQFTHHDMKGGGNCFAFATHQKYMIPAGSGYHRRKFGNSPLHFPGDTSEENFAKAMDIEGAIFLGRTNEQMAELLQEKLPVRDGYVYYIIAAFITTGEEYHFWGLWNDGWHCTPSLISYTTMDLGHMTDPSEMCPSSSMFMMMKKKNPKYDPDLGGFYLFPCRRCRKCDYKAAGPESC